MHQRHHNHQQKDQQSRRHQRTLSVLMKEAPGVVRITVTVDAGDAAAVARRLGSLTDVLSVRDITAARAGRAVAHDNREAEPYRAQADGVPE